jgi:hypothetical protein
VDRDGRNLSGGQKQRLAIARALVRNRIYSFWTIWHRPSIPYGGQARRSIRDLREKTGVTVIMFQRVASIRDAGQIWFSTKAARQDSARMRNYAVVRNLSVHRPFTDVRSGGDVRCRRLPLFCPA